MLIEYINMSNMGLMEDFVTPWLASRVNDKNHVVEEEREGEKKKKISKKGIKGSPK